MIVCTGCGFNNADADAFCGSCGGFLEWTGEVVAPDVVEVAPEEAPRKRGLMQRVQSVVFTDFGLSTPEARADGERIAPTPTAAPGNGGGPPARPGGAPAPSRPGGAPPPRPGGSPPARPGGGPPARTGGGGPPARPGASPPARPSGGPTPPTRPSGAPTPPPARPSGGPTPPPTRPSGGPTPPPTRPSGGPTPPSRPTGGPPARPGGSPPSPPTPPARPDGSAPTPPASAGTPAADPAALVAANATSPQPVRPAPPARPSKPITAPANPNSAAPATSAAPAAATSAVKPQRPVDRPKPVRQKPSRQILPGDLICGECGEGNPPGRKFCSRCGSNLVTAQVAKRAWWRRFVPHRRRKSLAAGERPWKATGDQKAKRPKRPKTAAVMAKVKPLAGAAILLGGLLFGVSPDFRASITSRIGDVKDRVMSKVRPEYQAMSPISIEATSNLEGGPPAFAIDGGTNTAWLAPETDVEPTLTVRFDQPVDIDRMIVHNGSAAAFKAMSRPAALHLVFDTGESFDVLLDDVPDAQTKNIDDASGVREIEVHVVDTYLSLESPVVALSEIEFFIRR